MTGRQHDQHDDQERPDGGDQGPEGPETLGDTSPSRFSAPSWARPDGGEGRQEPPSSGLSMPRWARSAGGSTGDRGWRGWRTILRRRLVWPVVIVLVIFAVWSNYPFIPNPWAVLFRQPDGDASAVSTPQRWASYGANAQGTNFIPDAAAPEGVVAYSIEVDGSVRSAPAVDGGTLYIGGQSRIAAYAAETGEQLWELPVNGPAHGTPAVADGLVYLGMLGKQVMAIDAASGDVAWEYMGDSPFPGSMGVWDGIVYAASRGGDVHALDAETGDLLWKVGTGSPVVAPAAASEGKMFAASTEGVLYIRHSRTGDKRARIRTGAVLVVPPVFADDRVYLLSNGDLLAFDANGREMPGRYPTELIWAQLWVWGFPLPAPPEHAGLLWRVSPSGCEGDFIHPPAVTPEALYLGTDDGCVLAIDLQDGSELWQIPPVSELRRVDGNLSWRMSTATDVAAPVLVAGDLLVVIHKNGTVRAIDRFTREEAWALSLESPPVAPLSYADGTVYAHTEDGRLHAIR